MKRIQEQATSVKATQEINKIIDGYNELSQDFGENNISSNEFIEKFNEINKLYNNERKNINDSINREKKNFTEKIKDYFNKNESDQQYINNNNKQNFISKLSNWIFNNSLTMKKSTVNSHKDGNTLMTINGVRLIVDGDWFKMINPDGTELFSKNINDGTEKALDKDIFKLTERTYIPANWNVIENSKIDVVGGKVMLPSVWNDLVIIVDNTDSNYSVRDKQNEHKLAPSYVYMCSAEVPIKFFTPYATAGLEVTKSYVMITAKTGLVAEDYVGNKSRNYGKVLKILWR